MKKDTIAKGFEKIAIPKEKQELIYELAKKKEYHHPLKVNTVVKRHKIRKAGACKKSIHTTRGVKYHYLAGKVNYKQIARAVGVSDYTVKRFLNCEHKKARESEENHKRYLRSVETGGYKKDRERIKKDWKKTQRNIEKCKGSIIKRIKIKKEFGIENNFLKNIRLKNLLVKFVEKSLRQQITEKVCKGVVGKRNVGISIKNSI